MNSMRVCFLMLFFSVIGAVTSFAQSVRDKIDQERRYMSYTEDKTIEKAREFIRMDSTYYGGYMVLGGFHFYRANDALGFTQVVVPLENAMRLLEKDFDKQLRTRTNDYFTFMRVNAVQNDYCSIAYWLQQSYQNIERPDKAMEVLRRVRARDLQFENGIETFNTMAWIYHRNRVYTPKSGKQYSFLKNSVNANDSMAYMLLDSSLINIGRNSELNIGIYDASYVNSQQLFVYHYKSILFDYNLELDSAEFYYDILLRTGYYSSNNYAEFRLAMGDFKMADDYFQEAEHREGSGEKRTKEYFYMRGTLDEYRAKPVEADSLLRRVIDRQGSTPGFGWHSIGLARALYYEGLTAESQARNNKAAKFNELHISTTWGQEQYNLAVEAINYTNAVRFEKEYYFENDQWYFWLYPKNWWKVSEFNLKTNNRKLILASLVAANPEREQVIYPVFSSENLMNFDEVWSVIDGFGADYFIRIYKKLLDTDKRTLIKKYYRYFLGKLYLSKGDKRKAREYFEEVITDPEITGEYNKLLYVRTCEGIALSTSDEKEAQYYTRLAYETFPQLLPFTDLKLEMRLKVNGQYISGSKSGMDNSIPALLVVIGLIASAILYYLIRAGRIKAHILVAVIPFLTLALVSATLIYYALNAKKKDPVSAIVDQIKDCAITITSDPLAPEAIISIDPKGEDISVSYTVLSGDKTIIPAHDVVLSVSKNGIGDAGKLLAYDLFGIQKTKIGDSPAAINAGKKPDPK